MNPAQPRRRRWLIAGALAAPFALALPQQAFIPSWYEASLYVANALLLLHLAAALLTIVLAVRRRSWSWLARCCASLALLLLAAAATFVTWNGAMREGILVCGRELDQTLDCVGGGQAFELNYLCIGGNPKTEVEVRPNVLPFMHRVAQESAASACAALKR